MTFDDYYKLLQTPKGSSYRLNYNQICLLHNIQPIQVSQHKQVFQQLLDLKLNHIQAIVNQKIGTIQTAGLQDVQTIRDFYHYFYYYLFYKSRALLISRDCFDCTWHRKVKSQLGRLINVQTNDVSLSWLTNNYDHYKNLRTIADYQFDNNSMLALLTPQTLTDAMQADWVQLQGLPL